jgi:hypothetical protein
MRCLLPSTPKPSRSQACDLAYWYSQAMTVNDEAAFDRFYGRIRKQAIPHYQPGHSPAPLNRWLNARDRSPMPAYSPGQG